METNPELPVLIFACILALLALLAEMAPHENEQDNYPPIN